MKQISEGTLIYKKQISEGWRRIKKERQLKKLKLAGAIILGLLLFSLWVAASSLDRPSFAKEQIRPIVVLTEIKVPPILWKIARCESNNTHWDGNGEVLRGKVDKSDIGKYQISLKYHGKKAEAMGIDLFDEVGNERYAIYLLENYGNEPWSAVRKCVNKQK